MAPVPGHGSVCVTHGSPSAHRGTMGSPSPSLLFETIIQCASGRRVAFIYTLTHSVTLQAVLSVLDMSQGHAGENRSLERARNQLRRLHLVVLRTGGERNIRSQRAWEQTVRSQRRVLSKGRGNCATSARFCQVSGPCAGRPFSPSVDQPSEWPCRRECVQAGTTGAPCLPPAPSWTETKRIGANGDIGMREMARAAAG